MIKNLTTHQFSLGEGAAMKIALVHDYLTQRGGAERVFELLCRRFPEADIFTSLYDPQGTIDLRDRTVNTTLLQKIPGGQSTFPHVCAVLFSGLPPAKSGRLRSRVEQHNQFC